MENDKCLTCNSIINEIKLFNGEDKYFCSFECVRSQELIELFRDFVQKKIDKYQYLHEEELIDFLHPHIFSSKERIKALIFEVIDRGYFDRKQSVIFQKGKIIRLGIQGNSSCHI